MSARIARLLLCQRWVSLALEGALQAFLAGLEAIICCYFALVRGAAIIAHVWEQVVCVRFDWVSRPVWLNARVLSILLVCVGAWEKNRQAGVLSLLLKELVTF